MSRSLETYSNLNCCKLCLNTIIKPRNLQRETYDGALNLDPTYTLSLLSTGSPMFLTPLVRFPFNKFFENYNNTVSGSQWNMIIFRSHNRAKIMTSNGFQSWLILPCEITKYDVKIYFYRQTMNNIDRYLVQSTTVYYYVWSNVETQSFKFFLRLFKNLWSCSFHEPGYFKFKTFNFQNHCRWIYTHHTRHNNI